LFRYVPFKENFHSNEIGSYTSFGIKAVDSLDHPIASVSDVSIDETYTAKLCELFTRQQLQPIHLLDVIVDTI